MVRWKPGCYFRVQNNKPSALLRLRVFYLCIVSPDVKSGEPPTQWLIPMEIWTLLLSYVYYVQNKKALNFQN